jgi:sugar/nucleoside kinase (ribokinase family)
VNGFVVVGDLMTDVVALSSGPLELGSDTRAVVTMSGGGSAANTSAWLAHLGQSVSYVGRVGSDLFGRTAVDELAQGGVDTRVGVDPVRPSGVCVVVVTPGGERSMFPSAGANEGLAPGDLPPELFAAGRHLHLSGYTLLTEGSRDAGLAALRLASDAGMTVSVDPSSVGLLRENGVAAFLRWTAGADVVLANAEEAQLLSGRTDNAEAGAVLVGRYREVVVKTGAQGAQWFGPDGAVARVPAVPVPVVDTTGAGDTFAAGFLPAWRAGSAPAESLRAGCAAAALVVGRTGARPPG